MSKGNRILRTPEEHIRYLFENTKSGQLPIVHYPTNGEAPFILKYQVDWTVTDVEEMILRHKTLVAQLNKLGRLYGELEDEEKRQSLLTAEELSVWETFVRPFEPFEVADSVIGELYFRGEFDELSEEENDLLERHYAWREAECLRRLPFNRRSSMYYVIRANRYASLVGANAPEEDLLNEALCLAEEMVLYYHEEKEDA